MSRRLIAGTETKRKNLEFMISPLHDVTAGSIDASGKAMLAAACDEKAYFNKP
jgi:hypothetical protein